jgi:hypothetical protein
MESNVQQYNPYDLIAIASPFSFKIISLFVLYLLPPCLLYLNIPAPAVNNKGPNYANIILFIRLVSNPIDIVRSLLITLLNWQSHAAVVKGLLQEHTPWRIDAYRDKVYSNWMSLTFVSLAVQECGLFAPSNRIRALL